MLGDSCGGRVEECWRAAPWFIDYFVYFSDFVVLRIIPTLTV